MLTLCFSFVFVLSLVHQSELVNTCGPDEFPCNDGSCVDKLKWCDSREDCDDDSDELYCLLRSTFRKNPNRCNETLFFLCNDGRCIPMSGRCDGLQFCFDNSDEENCGSAGNTSDVSVLLTKPSTETIDILSNFTDNESETFTNLYEHKMQADQAPLEEIVIASETANPVSEYKTSKPSSSSDSKRTDHPLRANVSIDVGNHVSKNLSRNSKNSRLPMNHGRALEFRDVLGGMLNVTTNNYANLDPSRSSISDLNTTKELNMTLEDSNRQNDQPLPLVDEVNVIQPDSKSPHTMIKDTTIYNGYVKLDTHEFRKTKEKALRWLESSRDEDYGWGDETARALVAFSMANHSKKPGHNSMTSKLMLKQLHLKLFTLMSRNETQRIPLGELALYINALTASCDNPKNFHGHDLVNILRHETNVQQESSKFVAPFVYLVLCLHNASTYLDVTKVWDMLREWNITKTDNEAVTSLAATCLSRMPQFSTIEIGQVLAKRLYQRIAIEGLPKNIYELALVTQALNEARINQDLWNRTEAMRQITNSQEDKGSFGDILSTYYVVPTLSGKSFLWISKICPHNDPGLVPVEVLKNSKDEKMYVSYSLRFGNPIEMSQRLTIKVQKNTSFMDIMRIAATTNSAYKFKYDVNGDEIIVYSIGGIANDAERGLYWVPYTTRNSSTNQLVQFDGDIRTFIPVRGESIAFWRKPMY